MSYKISERLERYFIANSGPIKPDPEGLNTFTLLDAWARACGINSPMPVYNVFEPTGVFNTLQGQMAFQAWHDRRHLILGKRFTLSGERDLALAHVDELLQAGFDPEEAAGIYFLIYGRNLFYFNNHRVVVNNVGAFVAECFRAGVSIASRARSLFSFDAAHVPEAE